MTKVAPSKETFKSCIYSIKIFAGDNKRMKNYYYDIHIFKDIPDSPLSSVKVQNFQNPELL